MANKNQQQPDMMAAMMAMMQMLSEQQGQNIESALKPRGKIAQSPKNNDFGQRGAGGIQSQYDWEAKKRQMEIQKQKDQNELSGLRQPQGQAGGGTGLGDFFSGLFGDGNRAPQGQAAKQNAAVTPGAGPNDKSYVSYDSREYSQSNPINKLTGLPFGYRPGMSVNPAQQGAADASVKRQKDAGYDPVAAGDARYRAVQSNEKQKVIDKKTGMTRRSTTYTPQGPSAVAFSQSPKATVVNEKGKTKTATGALQSKPEEIVKGLMGFVDQLAKAPPINTGSTKAPAAKSKPKTVNPNSRPTSTKVVETKKKSKDMSAFNNPFADSPGFDTSRVSNFLKMLNNMGRYPGGDKIKRY